ncbi:hypothetical protein D3C87_1742120 [compost metagenome]
MRHGRREDHDRDLFVPDRTPDFFQAFEAVFDGHIHIQKYDIWLGIRTFQQLEELGTIFSNGKPCLNRDLFQCFPEQESIIVVVVGQQNTRKGKEAH